MKGWICISPRYGPTMKTYSAFTGSGNVLNMSIRCSSEVLPATLTSGLGLLQVWGRMRVPQPAMGMTILRGSVAIGSYYSASTIKGETHDGPRDHQPDRVDLGQCQQRKCNDGDDDLVP